jgi:hypothetical protein
VVQTSGRGSGGSWYLAPSLVELIKEIDQLWPNRSKASDGSIGDASHQARPSDHNPDWNAGGVVRAIDVTTADIDFNRMLQVLKADLRTWYVIHDGFIYSRTYAFAKRKYTGPNPHIHHMHISIERTRAAASDTSRWITTGASGSKPTPPTPPPAVQNGELTMADVDKILAAIADLKAYQKACTVQIQDNTRQNVANAVRAITKYSQQMTVAGNNFTRQIVQNTDTETDAQRQAEMDAALDTILKALPPVTTETPDGIDESKA